LSGGRPEVGADNAGDVQANKIIAGLTSYTRNGEFMYNLRRLIGLKNGGEIAAIPDIQPPPAHPRAEGPPGNYYINFQDPAGQPTANPLIVNGKTYMKIGSADYSVSAGYGWFAPPDVHWLTTYLGSGPNVLQRSILYSDYGRLATFEFDLPKGVYNVTVSVGWQGGTYLHQKIDVEGVSFVDDEGTTPSNSYLVRTRTVPIDDSKLTMQMGIFDEYTMLNYLEIEAANPSVTDLQVTQAITSTGTLTATLGWTPPTSAVTTTLCYSTARITEANWASAILLTGTLPGGQSIYTASLPYTGGTVYFALKTQNAAGESTALSNNASWPRRDVYLPVVRR